MYEGAAMACRAGIAGAAYACEIAGEAIEYEGAAYAGAAYAGAAYAGAAYAGAAIAGPPKIP